MNEHAHAALVPRTLRLKVRPESCAWLDAAAIEVNTVWNWANEISARAARPYSGNPRYLAGFDLNNLSAGATAYFARIGAATIQRVNGECALKRLQVRRVKLRWRMRGNERTQVPSASIASSACSFPRRRSRRPRPRRTASSCSRPRPKACSTRTKRSSRVCARSHSGSSRRLRRSVPTISRDRAKARQLWTPWIKPWFPRGLDDPDLALVKVTIGQTEYWDAPDSGSSRLLGLARAVATGNTRGLGDNVKIRRS